jgi:hypothetical protein
VDRGEPRRRVETVAPETVALADAATLALAVDARSSTGSLSRRARSGGSVARHDGTIVYAVSR